MVWDKIALALTVIGALNWGCIGIFGFDVVAFLCGGQMAVLSPDHLYPGGPGRHLVHHTALSGQR